MFVFINKIEKKRREKKKRKKKEKKKVNYLYLLYNKIYLLHYLRL